MRPSPITAPAPPDVPMREGAGMIYLVRHGHAGNKRTWNGPDSQRSPSPTGRRESAGLVVRLRAEPIGRVLSSPALRCQQTVQPWPSNAASGWSWTSAWR